MIKTPLSTVLGGAFWTPGATVIGGNTPTFDQQILKLFANGEQGFYYDPNDLTTMFQDAAGVIPVTDVGQPVGLMLDKSKGLELGAELITNGTFDTGIEGWDSYSATLEYSGSQLKATATASTSGSVSQAISTVSGKFYVISCEITPDLSNTVKGLGRLNIMSGGVNSYTEGGLTDGVRNKVQIIVKANSALMTINIGIAKVGFWGGVGATLYIDNVSVKELTGNHAYQTTSASRPILRKNDVTGANYLEFDGSDDFLQTNSVDFTAVDEMTVIAAIRGIGGALNSIVIESSPSGFATNGSFGVRYPGIIGNTLTFTSRGTAYAQVNAGSNLIPPQSLVLTGSAKISTSVMSIRANGVAYSETLSQGSGNYGNYPLYIGRRAGTSLPLNGHLYGIIGIGKLIPESDVKRIEQGLAKFLGVTLNV
ncbi:LamG domain-containing protein [Acinetobacter lwoffii]|uniref:LamG domain-containing protein n=1 Tax=Acinetobacter lwoffii TaxID=28090 RepID=UPI0020986497|nr:LamG domain-containing protein [Acinetobacter lwoffii]MCO8081990.1 LamG domain-containing protein [Acinetobacter lwoffii]